jgi:hypothetical protein
MLNEGESQRLLCLLDCRDAIDGELAFASLVANVDVFLAKAEYSQSFFAPETEPLGS